MCQLCLVELRPDRNRVCLTTGSYLINFRECANCKTRNEIKIQNQNTEINDESTVDSVTNRVTGDYEEITTFSHTCQSCDHLICDHYSSFLVTNSPTAPESRVQEYMMDCMLCGRGADSSYVINDVGKENNEIPANQTELERIRIQTAPAAAVAVNLSGFAIDNIPRSNQNNQNQNDSEWE